TRVPRPDAEELERPEDVLLDREGRKEVERLEHDADLPEAEIAALVVGERCEVVAGDDDPPAIGAVETGDDVQQRALAGPARAHHGNELPGRHAERHVAQADRGLLADAVGAADVLEQRGRRLHRGALRAAPDSLARARTRGSGEPAEPAWSRTRRHGDRAGVVSEPLGCDGSAFAGRRYADRNSSRNSSSTAR